MKKKMNCGQPITRRSEFIERPRERRKICMKIRISSLILRRFARIDSGVPVRFGCDGSLTADRLSQNYTVDFCAPCETPK